MDIHALCGCRYTRRAASLRSGRTAKRTGSSRARLGDRVEKLGRDSVAELRAFDLKSMRHSFDDGAFVSSDKLTSVRGYSFGRSTQLAQII